MIDESYNYAEGISELVSPMDGLCTLLHKTDSEKISKKIIGTGFNFIDNLMNTTDNVGGLNEIHYDWWLTMRKAYGNQIIAIQFNQNKIYEHIKKFTNKKFLLDHVMSYQRFFHNEENEFVYTLPREYVKGYIDQSKGKINLNKDFNPNYVVPDEIIKRNIDDWL